MSSPISYQKEKAIFFLDTDASEVGLGDVLSHVQDRGVYFVPQGQSPFWSGTL